MRCGYAVDEVTALLAQLEYSPAAVAISDSSNPFVLGAESCAVAEEVIAARFGAVTLHEVGEVEFSPAGVVEDYFYGEDFAAETVGGVRRWFRFLSRPWEVVIGGSKGLETHKSGT